jgi:hypothetical protein
VIRKIVSEEHLVLDVLFSKADNPHRQDNSAAAGASSVLLLASILFLETDANLCSDDFAPHYPLPCA